MFFFLTRASVMQHVGSKKPLKFGFTHRILGILYRDEMRRQHRVFPLRLNKKSVRTKFLLLLNEKQSFFPEALLYLGAQPLLT